MIGLTPRQRDLLDFIAAEAREGRCPSHVEMMHRLGLASTSGVNRLLNGLEERGYIRRLPCRARAIEVLRQPPRAVKIGRLRYQFIPVADLPRAPVVCDEVALKAAYEEGANEARALMLAGAVWRKRSRAGSKCL